jgi:hypothetical protein
MVRLVLICVLVSAAACWCQTAVAITAHPESPGISIPSNFIGFSYEAGSLTTATGFAVSAASPVFQRMEEQVGPGVLRFGGNSVDQLTGWQRGQRTSTTSTSIMMSSDADRALNFARTVGYRVLWSVNLGHGVPATDADEAQYVYQTASDVLLGLEIGNEPDDYHSNGLRPTTYTTDDYLAEWQTYANAIQTETPTAVLTGPAGSGSITTFTSAFATAEGSRIALLTQHFYPLAPSSKNPTAKNVASIPDILDDAIRQTANTDGSELEGIAQGQKIPWRMSETNSCYDGGQAGVSDVFASALWGVDYMFTLAGNSGTGVNFHGGGTGNYTPIAVSSAGVVTPRPLYYALLMFRAAARGRLVPVNVSANGVNLTAYGALDSDRVLRVTVINKDMTNNATVSIKPGKGYSTASAMRLAAPAADSTTGITLGGASVQANGVWSATQLENLSASGGTFAITVPAVSAVLISFGNGSTGPRRPHRP